ncbi:MAG: hypothetical protein K0R15_1440 [Clostridiales bacterium]|jgi:hypothetical protein|nr:hypothetical protein [Clostridiales bacterium]
MKTILVLILLFSVPAFFAASKNKRFEQVLAPTVFGVTILLTIGGMFDLLLPTLYLVVGILIIAAIASVFFAIKRPKVFIRNMFTPAFVVIILWVILIFATQTTRKIVAWDEYTHWGLTVKAMTQFDKLGSFDIVPTVYKDYPPATAVFGYFWTKLAGFTEPGMIGAFTFMILSMLLVGMKNMTWKKWKYALVYATIVPLLPLLFFPQTYTAVLIDPMICITFAYIMLVALLEKDYNKFKLVRIMLGLIVLTLLKTTGVLAAVFVALFVALDYVSYKKNILKNKHREAELSLEDDKLMKKIKKEKNAIYLMALIIILVPIATQAAWGIHTYIVDTGVIFSATDVSLIGLFKAFTGSGLEYQNETMKSYATELFNMKLYGQKFTFVGITMGLLILSQLIRLVIQEKEERKRFDRSNFINHLWGAIYIIATLVAYLFTFRESEALVLSCFDRYVSIFPAGTVIILAIYIMNYATNIKTSRANHLAPSLVLITAAIVIILFPGKVIMEHYTATYVVEQRQKIEEEANIVLEKTKETDKVFLVAQKSNGFEYFITKYYLLPRNANSILTFDIGNVDEGIGDGKRTISNSEEFADILIRHKYTHVFLVKYNSTLWDDFDESFEKVAGFRSARLFRIEHINDKEVKLIPVK